MKNKVSAFSKFIFPVFVLMFLLTSCSYHNQQNTYTETIDGETVEVPETLAHIESLLGIAKAVHDSAKKGLIDAYENEMISNSTVDKSIVVLNDYEKTHNKLNEYAKEWLCKIQQGQSFSDVDLVKTIARDLFKQTEDLSLFIEEQTGVCIPSSLFQSFYEIYNLIEGGQNQ